MIVGQFVKGGGFPKIDTPDDIFDSKMESVR